MPTITDLDCLAARSRLLRATREWFHGQGFLEVETPVRVPAPPPEVHIDAFRSEEAFLRPSPELYLKRLVASGAGKIYELGPCFRRGERGALHNPEYTMLEWYRTGTDYRGVLDDCRSLLREVCTALHGSTTFACGGRTIDLSQDWAEVSVRDIYRECAGWDPLDAFDEDRFDIDFVEKILPQLPRDVPVVLKDYPVEAAALARCAGGTRPYAERWELLIGGIELANAYSELCDAREQRRRFDAWNAQRRDADRDVYPLDNDFLKTLAAGLPDCGGVAVGIDRLLMVLMGFDSIDKARPFCTSSPEIA